MLGYTLNGTSPAPTFVARASSGDLGQERVVREGQKKGTWVIKGRNRNEWADSGILSITACFRAARVGFVPPGFISLRTYSGKD